MADHGHASPPALHGIDAHQATYHGFLNWSVLAGLECAFIAIALVTFRFMDGWLALVTGFGGIIIGLITALIGMRMGGKWLLPAVVLVLYGLFVAANVHGA
jgi:hypothetical protein